ncbi:unnamed protein product [Ectocarpus sp. 4 AP-2014]
MHTPPLVFGGTTNKHKSPTKQLEVVFVLQKESACMAAASAGTIRWREESGPLPPFTGGRGTSSALAPSVRYTSCRLRVAPSPPKKGASASCRSAQIYAARLRI